MESLDPKFANGACLPNRLSLLGMPGQLRNMIYRYAILSDHEIQVDAGAVQGIQEPACEFRTSTLLRLLG
jgi:hypothetical protein